MTSKINCDSLLAAPPQPPRDLSESEVAKSFSQYVREIASPSTSGKLPALFQDVDGMSIAASSGNSLL